MPLKDPEARRAYQKKYAEKHKDRLAQYHAEYRDRNHERIVQEKRTAWHANAEENRRKLRERYAANPEKYKEIARKKYARDAERWRVYANEYRKQNPLVVKEGKKRYAKENRGLINAAVARRKAALLRRTPSWITQDELWVINEIYDLATARTKATGVQWHVDHKVPLQGELVSGLHIPDNLQVILGAENVRKHNCFRVG
jgi:hypothetical protein